MFEAIHRCLGFADNNNTDDVMKDKDLYSPDILRVEAVCAIITSYLKKDSFKEQVVSRATLTDMYINCPN
jgi:hypothetical protein